MRPHALFGFQNARCRLSVARSVICIQFTDRKLYLTELSTCYVNFSRTQRLIGKRGAKSDRASQRLTTLVVHVRAERTNAVGGEDLFHASGGSAPHDISDASIADQFDILSLDERF